MLGSENGRVVVFGGDPNFPFAPCNRIIALLRDPVERALSEWNMLRLRDKKDHHKLPFDQVVRCINIKQSSLISALNLR